MSGIDIKTSLTLSPPGEDSVSEAKGEDEEAAAAEETETGDRKEEDEEEERSNKVVEQMEDNACLVTIMKRMIADEVRKYIDSLWAHNSGPGPGPNVRKDP